MDFKAVIKEQREELERIEKEENLIKREKLEEAERFLKHPNILAVIGIRRCGKSIFSYLLAKGKSFGYINFDDERLAGIAAEDLNKVLQDFYELYGSIDYIILDEVQNIEKWELFANRLRRTKKVIITGSSSKLLSGELATHMTGRYVDIELFPFSFNEFLNFRGFKKSDAYTTREIADIFKLLSEYLKMGGFPEVHKFGRPMLPRIYNDIITKDILLRCKIKKTEDIRKLANYLITNFASEISYSKLAKILGVKHVSTISKWMRYLEDSFLVLKLDRFDFKLKQQFLAPKKVYCIDTGIINAVGFELSKNLGKLMENSVAVELKRKLDGTEIYYWKDYRQNEVDFVVKAGEKIKQIIQVTYANKRDEIKEREVKSLLRASSVLKCKKLVIITWDYENFEKINGKTILFVPLWKWFLYG